MIKELISSISSNVRERAASPILGSYAITVILMHWKPIIVLLTSKNSGTALVSEAEKFLPSIYLGFIFPLLISFIFSIGYPHLKSFIIQKKYIGQEKRTPI